MKNAILLVCLLMIVSVACLAEDNLPVMLTTYQRKAATSEPKKEARNEAPPEKEANLDSLERVSDDFFSRFWQQATCDSVASPDSRWASDEFYWFPFGAKPFFVEIRSEYSISASPSIWPEESYQMMVGVRVKTK